MIQIWDCIHLIPQTQIQYDIQVELWEDVPERILRAIYNFVEKNPQTLEDIKHILGRASDSLLNKPWHIWAHEIGKYCNEIEPSDEARNRWLDLAAHAKFLYGCRDTKHI
jgi:hypothetical protein